MAHAERDVHRGSRSPSLCPATPVCTRAARRVSESVRVRVREEQSVGGTHLEVHQEHQRVEQHQQRHEQHIDHARRTAQQPRCGACEAAHRQRTRAPPLILERTWRDSCILEYLFKGITSRRSGSLQPTRDSGRIEVFDEDRAASRGCVLASHVNSRRRPLCPRGGMMQMMLVCPHAAEPDALG